jgi:hypothetical protein
MLSGGWGNLLAAAATLFAMAVAGPAFAGPAATGNGNVNLHVDSVVASDTHEGVDNRLAAMGPRLESLFNYSTYRLISHQDGQTQMGTLLVFNLPGGRILDVQPHQAEGDMIDMELVLFQGERPLMTTDLKLRNHGILIVGGPRYEQGMLIISIGADCRCPRGHGADASAMQPHPASSASAASSVPE